MSKTDDILKKIKLTKEEVLNDYRIANESRQASLLGRREVLTGKAKFGIFGDGKEIPQLAMAHAFKNGDWRSGYYRDQTFMLATGMMTLEEVFAQLYGDTDPKANPGNYAYEVRWRVIIELLVKEVDQIPFSQNSKICTV